MAKVSKVISEAILDVQSCHAWELGLPSPKGTIVAIAGHPEMPADNADRCIRHAMYTACSMLEQQK